MFSSHIIIDAGASSTKLVDLDPSDLSSYTFVYSDIEIGHPHEGAFSGAALKIRTSSGFLVVHTLCVGSQREFASPSILIFESSIAEKNFRDRSAMIVYGMLTATAPAT